MPAKEESQPDQEQVPGEAQSTPGGESVESQANESEESKPEQIVGPGESQMPQDSQEPEAQGRASLSELIEAPSELSSEVGRSLFGGVVGVRGFLMALIVGSVVGLMLWSISLRADQGQEQLVVLTEPAAVLTHAEAQQVEAEKGQEQPVVLTAPAAVLTHVEPEQVEADEVEQEQASLSWTLAEKAYAAGKYELAVQSFRRFLPITQVAVVNERVNDFFRLRIGQCLRELGQLDEARKLFRSLLNSSSPVVVAVASLVLAELELNDGQYMQARTWAYRAIAQLGAVKSSTALKNDCNFLIARALTEKALSFYGAKLEISWPRPARNDIFINLDKQALRSLLDEGCENYDLAILGPKIRKEAKGSGGHRWSVSATQSSLEELLAVFGLTVGVDVQWVLVSPQARSRPVTVSYSDTSAQRFFEIACGANGLLARFSGDEIMVHDPRGLASIAKQRDLLARETISTWRRLFLRLSQDNRVARGHLALAILYELSGDTTAAIGEYQLTANRFGRSKVAPLAMLRCAKLRIRLGDYGGACQELLDLVDRYPDCDALDEVYLSLGQANMDSGNLPGAVQILTKLYYLGLSRASKVQSCLIMGKSFYQLGQYDQAYEWLVKYFSLAKDREGDELAGAYILLAKCEKGRGNAEEAARALVGALAARPSEVKHTEALFELARIQAEQECFDEVITKFSTIAERDLSSAQKHELLVLTTEVYRSMGLSERAAGMLNTKIPTFSDQQIQASLKVELAHCYVDLNELVRAEKKLGEALPVLPSGRQRYQATCDLAEIYLKLDRVEEAITMSRELLSISSDNESRRRALRVLASANVAKHDYQTAALALADMLGDSGEDAQ